MTMPSNFKPAEAIEVARLCEQPQFASASIPKGVKGKGIRYETAVAKKLDELEEWEGVPGPWFEFVDRFGHRYAQPDWLGFDVHRGICTIVEVKLSRTERAWWQLNKLYLPLVQHVFEPWDVALVEVVANMKPVSVPGKVAAISSLSDAKPGTTSLLRVAY